MYYAFYHSMIEQNIWPIKDMHIINVFHVLDIHERLNISNSLKCITSIKTFLVYISDVSLGCMWHELCRFDYDITLCMFTTDETNNINKMALAQGHTQDKLIQY